MSLSLKTSILPTPPATIALHPPRRRRTTEKLRQLLDEFSVFTWKQVQASLFAVSFFILLLLSPASHWLAISRYDFLFAACLLLQVMLLLLRIETLAEIRVIFLFHIVGFVLELFKTAPGIASWSYPEAGLLKIATVPLYSGFMYSAIGSYINQAWKVFNLQYSRFPSLKLLLLLSIGIYLNFFTHHFLPDIRWWLILAVFLIFRQTTVHFTLRQTPRKMPLALSFLLIGLFIWVAENISTFLGAWRYPDQAEAWTWVASGKISSWFLLVIVSFNIVALLHHRNIRQEQTSVTR